MLSYRHAFHAGNHADVFKHSVLSRIVLYLIQKKKPFSYIDTHAGAGLYRLDSDWAKKTDEAAEGIRRLLDAEKPPEEFYPYLEICRNLSATGDQYPGSPEIVRALSRSVDQLTLMELHSNEIGILRENFSGDPRIHIHFRDGFAGLQALTPPEPRRGFVLMDPSYETVGDYSRTAESLLSVHRHWNAGMLVLWYPVLGRRREEIRTMKNRFSAEGIPGILTAELMVDKMEDSFPFSPATGSSPGTNDEQGGFGLAGSGLLFIQPPWTLADEMGRMLPFLAETLGRNGNGSWNIEWLTDPENEFLIRNRTERRQPYLTSFF
jgi:23S rRNA (adenine2030-N6)-methyltransferase